MKFPVAVLPAIALLVAACDNKNAGSNATPQPKIADAPQQATPPPPASDEAPAAAPTLDLDFPAPPLTVAQWLKGEPIAKLEEGKVYVVEFWATWCGPCRATVPHLSELAKQYEGQIQFMGISVFEREPDAAARRAGREEFIKEMGDKMTYAVGGDEGDVMADTWMKAAGQTGIPTAFVVGKNGRIAWIGHPTELDKILPAVLDGTYDVKAALAERAKARIEQAEFETAMKPIGDAANSGKFAEAIALIDKLVKEKPDFAPSLETIRLRILLRADLVAAHKELRALADNGVDESKGGLLSTMAIELMSRKGRTPEDIDLALALMHRLEATVPANSAVEQNLAQIYLVKRNRVAALAHAEAARKIAVDSAPGDADIATEAQNRYNDLAGAAAKLPEKPD